MSSTNAALLLLLSASSAFAQADIVKSEGITSPLHQANLGRIVFTSNPVAVDSLRQPAFLDAFDRLMRFPPQLPGLVRRRSRGI